ncbi:MAG: MBL fold metallo-hydrolase [Candidatus Pacebacteria bacterium]|nr:MBL fold metallo-hydrolase [Candidatus Paceibacterota bacterium]
MNFNKRNRLVLAILALLVFLNIITWLIAYDLNKENLLKIVFFDVGEGDSIFIETPFNQQILIDGGPGSRVLEKLAEEMPFYDNSLDLVVLTHPDYDHLSGLIDVLKRYDVYNILWTGVLKEGAEFNKWIEVLEKENANEEIAFSKKRIILSENPFIFMDILYPFDNLKGLKTDDANDTSVVLRLSFSNVSILFPGDISKKAEKEIVNSAKPLDSDILKAAHHGSSASSSLEFLREVSPSTAVISVGKDNKYNHPSSEVLARFKDFGIEVLRTDEMGDIKIITNGRDYKIY